MIKLRGFTLSEVIVVVAVLAVVLTIATPDMNRLFVKQAEMQEELRMRKLYTALELYSKENKALPSSSNWHSQLQPYTDLSLNEVRFDVWDVERRYSTFTRTESYMDTSYTIHYATLMSLGLNGDADGISLPTNQSNFASFAYDSTDNFAVKFTDQANKIKLLETTFQRMERLSEALAKNARVRQIQGIAANPDTADEKIYFVNDGRESSASYYGTTDVLTTGNNRADGLARVLGLPEYYGENALTDSTMWYISNPGPNGTCAGSRSTAPFYPPIISLANSNPC